MYAHARVLIRVHVQVLYVLCMHLRTYLYVCIGDVYTGLHICVCMCVSVCVWVCVGVCVHVCVWVCVGVCVHEVTHREITVPDHRDEPCQEPDQYPRPGLDDHVGHRPNCHTPC